MLTSLASTTFLPAAVADSRQYVGSDDCWSTKFCVVPPCNAAVAGVVCFAGGHVTANSLGRATISLSDAVWTAGPVAGFACQADATGVVCGGSGTLHESFCSSTTIGDGDGWVQSAPLYVYVGGSVGSLLMCGVAHPGTAGTVSHAP